jgi:hypothetical protein
METTEIGLLDGDNAGYVKELILVRKDDVEFLENPILYPNLEEGYVYIPGSLRVKTDDVFFKIAFAWRKCQFTEESEPTANGFLYNNVVLWEWPKNRPAIQQFLLDYQHDEFIAFFRDGNDSYHIAGNQDVGLELQYIRSITDTNKINVQLQGSLTFPTLQTAESDLELLFQLIEFSSEFSTDFNA